MPPKKITAEELAKVLEEEPEERYWCPYCGRPLNIDKDYVRGWRFHSPKGGAYFMAKIYKCPRCEKKMRVTKQEPGLKIEEDKL